MSEQPLSERSIFLAAIDRESPAERAAYLDQACGGDPRLRTAVEALLAAHDRLGRLWSAPVGTATVEAPPATEHAGVAVGRYQLLQEIGEGGMGSVWLAQQTEPVQRLVALKLIKPGMDSAQVLARFEAERQALALMDHPHIARVLDGDTTPSGRPYFVMDLVKGMPITRYSDEHRLTPRQRLELFLPVCQAVQHAHTKGIIHRDLKPANVLVASSDGKPVPKVIDFGVAKATGPRLTERTLFTELGAVVGTLEYMSPEQAELNNQDIDTRSDIYALGVLLYELLTGSTPLERKRLKQGALLEALRVIREEEPPRPSARLSALEELPRIAARRGLEPKKLCGLVKSELDWIVMKCLDKERSRRYETVNGLALDIERYLHDEPVQAGPPSTAYRLRKFVQRNRGPVLATVGVLLALVTGVVGTTVGLVRAVQSERDAVEARDKEARQRQAALKAEAAAKTNERKAKDERAQAMENERAAKFQALRAENARHAIQIDLALRAWERNEMIEAERVLNEVSDPFQQTWEQRHLRDLCKRKALTLLGHTGGVYSVAISSDGQRIISGSRDGTIKVWDATTGQEKLTLKGRTRLLINSVAHSNDGRRIVSGCEDGTVQVWDATTGQEKLTVKGHREPVYSVAFSPDGRCFASGGFDMAVKVWDAATGQEKLILKGHTEHVNSVAFSGDGRHIVSGSHDRTIKVWDADTGREKLTLKGHTLGVNSVVFSSDGQAIVSGGNDRTVKVWDAVTGQEKLTLKGHEDEVWSVASSNNGLWIVSGEKNGRFVKVWDAVSGQAKLTFKGHTGAYINVAISGDGQRIVSGSLDSTVRVWGAAEGQERLSLKGHTFGRTSVAISGDGRRIVSGGNDRTVKVWDAATGQAMLTLKGHKEPVSCVAISSDGRRIVSGGGFINGPGEVKVWDAETGKVKLTLAGHTEGVTGVAISGDGRRIVSGSYDATVRVWDATTGQEQLAWNLTLNVHSVAISANGRYIVAGCADKTVRVWDATTGREKLTLPGHTWYVTSVAITGDGRLIVSGTWDRDKPGEPAEIKVWDADTGQERLALKGNTGRLESLAISADGGRIVSGNWDSKVRVWDTATGQEKLTLKIKGPRHIIDCVAISGDDQRIVSGSRDGTVRMWEAPISSPAPRTPKSP
jgi:WD40 repeat protein